MKQGSEDAGRKDLFPGAVEMMVLHLLRHRRLHGYALVQIIKRSSQDLLQVEEGSLYPALQKLLIKGWVKADWAMSDTGRQVRVYRLTPAGRKQLDIELTEFRRTTRAIQYFLDTA